MPASKVRDANLAPALGGAVPSILRGGLNEANSEVQEEIDLTRQILRSSMSTTSFFEHILTRTGALPDPPVKDEGPP